jgi:hypothetical protein
MGSKFCLRHPGVHTGSGATPVSHQCVLKAYFRGVKRPKREVELSAVYSIEYREQRSFTPPPLSLQA